MKMDFEWFTTTEEGLQWAKSLWGSYMYHGVSYKSFDPEEQKVLDSTMNIKLNAIGQLPEYPLVQIYEGYEL
jgi:hypothetical protein